MCERCDGHGNWHGYWNGYWYQNGRTQCERTFIRDTCFTTDISSLRHVTISNENIELPHRILQAATMMTSSKGIIFRVTGHLCGEFTGSRWIPRKRPVKRSFDVYFDLRLNKRLSKQAWGWWFETPSCPIWRHCNDCRTLVRGRGGKCVRRKFRIFFSLFVHFAHWYSIAWNRYEVRDIIPWEMLTKMVISWLLNVEKIWNSAQINWSSILNLYRKYVFDATISTEKPTSEIDANFAQNEI